MPYFKHNQQSITSFDISELVLSRHDDVKRSIERLAERGVIALPPMAVMPKEANNRIYNVEIYVFTGEQGKLDSITVVAQLCPEFTAENSPSRLQRHFNLQRIRPKRSNWTNLRWSTTKKL